MGLSLQRPVSHLCAEIEADEHEATLGAKSAKIRTLNDRFRKALTDGRVMMTAAVSAQGQPDLARTALYHLSSQNSQKRGTLASVALTPRAGLINAEWEGFNPKDGIADISRLLNTP
jgi:hypothetical protein